MIHKMRLHEVPFNAIKEGKQMIEIRLYDAKRRKIHIGDKIVFLKRPEESEKIVVNVTRLSIFKSFSDLFQAVSKTMLGYKMEDTLEYQLSCIRKYYSVDDEKKYGVVAIYLN